MLKCETNRLSDDSIRGSYRTGCFDIHLSGDFQKDIFSMSTTDQGVFLHEYIHFLQNISTPWGIFAANVQNRCFVEFVGEIEAKQHLQIPYIPSYSAETQLQVDWMKCSMGTKELNAPFKIDRNVKIPIKVKDRIEFPTPMHDVYLGLTGIHGERVPIRLGASIIKEGMAAMFQALIDDKATHPDVPYNVIQILASQHFPNISQDSRKLITLCYISLFNLDPGFALLCELMEAETNPEKSFMEIFDEFIHHSIKRNGESISAYRFFDEMADIYKQSVQGIIQTDIVYVKEVLDKVKASAGTIPIISILNNDPFTPQQIYQLVDFLGVPFVQARNVYAYPANDKGEVSKDIINVVGNTLMFQYFVSPSKDYIGICPFMFECPKDREAECYECPWKCKECDFQLGLEAIHANGKTIEILKKK